MVVETMQIQKVCNWLASSYQKLWFYRTQIFMLLKKYQSNIYKSYGGGGGAHFITFNK